MAKHSVVEYVGDGVQDTFAVNFTGGYMEDEHVTVQVGEEVGFRERAIVSPGVIQVGGTTPAVGEPVVFRRNTPVDFAINDFSAGALFSSAALDASFEQAIKSIQEAQDGVGDAADLSDAVGSAEAAAAVAVAAAESTGTTYASRATFEAAVVDATVRRWDIYSPPAPAANLRVVSYRRADVGETNEAIESANGVKGVPALTTTPEHWGDNLVPGTTDMAPHIRGAFAYADDVYFRKEVYRCNSTVLISENRKSWHGVFGTILRGAQPAGDPCVWLANVDPHTSGNIGPVNTKFNNIIFQKFGASTAPMLRATVAVNTFLRGCEFWGGSPDILLEGCQNFEGKDVRTSPTVAYLTPQKAQIIQTYWQYASDNSFRRGYSVTFEGGSMSSSTTPGVSLYDRTMLVESSDGFMVRGTYFGSSTTSFEVKPTESTMKPGSVRVRDVWFDDGGTAFIGATKIKVDTSDVNASRVPFIDIAQVRCSSNNDQLAVHLNEVNGKIDGIRSSGGLFSGAYEELFLIEGDAEYDGPSIHLDGGEITGWGSNTPAGAFDLNLAGSVTLDGVNVNGWTAMPGSDIFKVRSGGAGFISVAGGTIRNYAEAGGNGIISTPSFVSRISIDAGTAWIDGDITKQLRYNDWGNFGVGVDVSGLITDFDLEIPAGSYRYDEAVTLNPPMSGSFKGKVIVLRGNSAGTTFIAYRDTASINNQHVLTGYRGGASGTITWDDPLNRAAIPVADLPNAGGNVGRAFLVSDASVAGSGTSYWTEVIGGGSNTVSVKSDGSSWRIG